MIPQFELGLLLGGLIGFLAGYVFAMIADAVERWLRARHDPTAEEWPTVRYMYPIDAADAETPAPPLNLGDYRGRHEPPRHLGGEERFDI